MSSEIESRERLSALLDGEVADSDLDQILREFDEKPRLRADWDRLCRSRAAIEGIDVSTHVDICDGVMAAVRESGMSEKVVPLLPRRRSWVQPRTIGIAAAASIAAVATVTSIRLHQAAPQQVAAAAPAAVVAQAVPVAVPVTAAAPIAAEIDPDSQSMLDDFVIEHSNYRVVQMGSSLSYARFAAHTAEFRPNDGQP